MKKGKILWTLVLLAFIAVNKTLAYELHAPFGLYSFTPLGSNAVSDNYLFLNNNQFNTPLDAQLDFYINKPVFNIHSNLDGLLSDNFVSINKAQFGVGTGTQDGFETGNGTEHEFGYNDPGYIPIKGGLYYLVVLCLIYTVVLNLWKTKQESRIEKIAIKITNIL